MRKYLTKLVLMTIIIISLISAGCQLGGKQSPDKAIQNVRSGTEGLEMDFIKNLPPSKIYDSSSMTLVADLENQGAYDLDESNCILHLHGFDKNTFVGLQKTAYCGNIKGKSIEYPYGERNTVEFRTDTINLMEGLDSFPQNFVMTSCYDYETIATPSVCIDPTFYDINPVEGACRVGPVSMSGGQGAPVAVTRVGVNMIGKDRVNFEIDIRNVGGGKVLRNGIDLFNTCPVPKDYRDYDVVDYDVVMSSGTKVRCSPELEGGPRVKLTNGAARIICTYEISEETAYTTQLNIWLGYSYMDSISKSVEILRTP